MGCFSWLFADKNNTENLKIGDSGYIACPDGSFIKTSSYGGYGRFSGRDVYELIVDWNRPHLKEILSEREIRPSKAKRDSFITDELIALVMESDKKAQEYVDHHINKNCCLRWDWKRNLGIYLACYDEDNEAIPFSIKIAKTTNCRYEELPASKGDPEQGFC